MRVTPPSSVRISPISINTPFLSYKATTYATSNPGVKRSSEEGKSVISIAQQNAKMPSPTVAARRGARVYTFEAQRLSRPVLREGSIVRAGIELYEAPRWEKRG